MGDLKNSSAWLHKAGSTLEVGDAVMPSAGPGEIVVKNAAVAINPLDWHMQDSGVFVQQWPTVFGCDVGGYVIAVGAGAERFKEGNRVIGHCINLVTGRPSDGAYSLYTVLPANKAAILPDRIPFTDGVVVPFALEAALCALSVEEPEPCMPGVLTPALALPLPSLDGSRRVINKTIVVYGASSSVGSMTVQIATAAGIKVIAIAGAHNHDLVKRCGAARVFDHKDETLVGKVIEVVRSGADAFVGVVDAISIPDTYEKSLAILAGLGGGHLACVHPPPTVGVPDSVQTGMIFAVNDIATNVFNSFVTSALESGLLKCLPPPTVVGKGLSYVNEALQMSKQGISGTKLVVEL